MKETKMLRVVLGIGIFIFPFTALSITKEEIMSVSIRVADRIASQKPIGRNWEDDPLLSGLLPLAGNMEKDVPDSGKRFLELVGSAIGDGYNPITNGDYAGYATASLDFYQLSTNAELRKKLLRTTDGPLAFARFAIRATPKNTPPMDNWWVYGGYGTRFWVDDLFTIPPWLAMLGSTQNGLPANTEAHDLAYEWVQAYVGLLWDKEAGLFWHDLTQVGSSNYWGRGNGWAAYGLVRTAGYLDTPYAGGVAQVLGPNEIRQVLTQMATTLILRRAPDGGWPSDLSDPLSCETETSATGLITFMFARGVNEGWLNRRIYAPVAIKALTLLFNRVDSLGNVSGIQPPGTGPDCYTVFSDDPSVNVNYGVGALLLAAQEVAKFNDECLFSLECPRKEKPQREISSN